MAQYSLGFASILPSRSSHITPSISLVSPAFDPQEMILRFRERADAVKRRGLPPVEGPERLRFMEAAKIDFQDFAMLGDATATLENGILRLEIDLRPPGA